MWLEKYFKCIASERDPFYWTRKHYKQLHFMATGSNVIIVKRVLVMRFVVHKLYIIGVDD